MKLPPAECIVMGTANIYELGPSVAEAGHGGRGSKGAGGDLRLVFGRVRHARSERRQDAAQGICRGLRVTNGS